MNKGLSPYVRPFTIGEKENTICDCGNQFRYSYPSDIYSCVRCYPEQFMYSPNYYYFEGMHLTPIQKKIVKNIIEPVVKENKTEIKTNNIQKKKPKEIIKRKGLSQFLIDYKFYRIRKSKTILFAILDNTKGKIYLKSKEAFLEEIYNIALEYSNDKHIITEVFSRLDYCDPKWNNQTKLYNFILENNGIKLVEDIIFKPIPERLIELKDGTYLNEYTPTKYLLPTFNNKCKDEKKFPHIKSLILNLCNNDINAYKYFLAVLKHSIQKPFEKRHGYLVFQGEGASGKGTFFELILTPIFEDYIIIDTEEIFRTQFSEYSYKSIWAVIEEKEDTRGKGSLGSTIKYVSGNAKGISEAKGRDRRTIDDYRNFIITTNETNPGLDLKGHDRRGTIFGYSRALGGNKSKAPQIRKVLEQNIPNELDNFVSYLKNTDFSDIDIYNAYENEARQNILELDMNNTERFIDELKSYKGSLLNHILDDYNIEFKSLYLISRDSGKNKGTWIHFEDIYKIFMSWCNVKQRIKTKDNKFSQEFKNVTGLKTERIKDKNRENKFYKLKDILEYFELKIDFNFNNNEIKADQNFTSEDIENMTIDLAEEGN